MNKLLATLLIFFPFLLCFAQETGARYLIITHDDFYEAIQPLAQWKTKKGLETKVVKLSETGSDSTQIRNYIINAYNNWIIKPEYLLLVGAPNFLPFFRIGTTYRTDNYYTNMNGDIYNEILPGRLTVHDLNEAQTVINKILLYERTPNIQDSLWFRKACLIYRVDGEPHDDSIYRSDVNHAAGLMVSNGYITIDTMAGGDNATDVINAVNNGRSFVMYRGTGVNNWFPPFDVQPDSLDNGSMLPIVLSMTCLTIGGGATPAVAEKWFLTGTPTQPRGAAGYFAPTTAILDGAYLRSAATKGFFDALFIDKKIKFGEVCEASRLRVYQMYPNGAGLDEYYGLTTLGDPEMNLWTGTPKEITVLHDSMLHVGNETLNVQVTYSGVPVESAYVCAMFDTSIYETGYTDENGNLFFVLYLSNPGDLELTITGMNLYPQEITIPIIVLSIRDNESTRSAILPELAGYPNPSANPICFRYQLNKGADVQFDIYDISGRLVQRFHQGKQAPGNYKINWISQTSGVYFYRLTAGGFRVTNKIITF